MEICSYYRVVRTSHPGKCETDKGAPSHALDSLSLCISNPQSTNAIILNILKALKEKKIEPFDGCVL
jgi:hypothetical protein